MRKELELMELVDRYLNGELNQQEVTAFEERLANNNEFAELVEDQRALRAGMQRMKVRQAAKKAYWNYRLGKWGPALGGLIILVIASALFFGNFSGLEENVAADSTIETALVPSNDLGLETLLIDYDPAENSTLITPGGIVLDVPKDAFLYLDGSLVNELVNVEFQEALDAADIMKAGLSTMSGDQLLETGGMFFIDAKANGKQLKINPNKSITAMVPDKTGGKDMQLFNGVEQQDGSIDWQDPTPLVRSLVPVDITTLDFYPPKYLPKLAELGENVRNKKFTDSLYYSFSCRAIEPKYRNGGAESVFGQLNAAFINMSASATRLLKFAQADSESSTDTLVYEFSTNCEVNPAKIKTIWNARFNNTNLATREFEERLRAVFGTCKNSVLDKYVNNLDKNLYEIDQELAAMGYEAFSEFASRNDGKVDLPQEAAKRLARVYKEWSVLEAAAIRKTQESFWNKQSKLDNEALQRTNADVQTEKKAFNKRYARELKANMCSAYKQLGKPCEQRAMPNAAFVVPVRNLGWKNVDQYVREATANRESMDYTDPVTGKKAKLTYTPFAATVKNANEFDQLRVYLLPRELNSYQRIRSTTDLFEENLNALFEYDLYAIGVKDGERYFAESANVHKHKKVSLKLKSITENKLLSKLNRRGNVQGTYLLNRTNFMLFAEANKNRQKRNFELQELRSAVSEVIYCQAPFESVSFE